jgi:hypothetical protein
MTNQEPTDSKAPPPVVACERVLFYALLDSSVGFREGHGLVFSGKAEVGRVPCLAICEDRRSAKFSLNFCDSDWTPCAVAAKNSVDQAKNLAERIYPGSMSRWTEANVTVEEAERCLDKMFEGQNCNFCKKRPDQVQQMFGSNERNAYICDACIAGFNRELQETSWYQPDQKTDG